MSQSVNRPADMKFESSRMRAITKTSRTAISMYSTRYGSNVLAIRGTPLLISGDVILMLEVKEISQPGHD